MSYDQYIGLIKIFIFVHGTGFAVYSMKQYRSYGKNSLLFEDTLNAPYSCCSTFSVSVNNMIELGCREHLLLFLRTMQRKEYSVFLKEALFQ